LEDEVILNSIESWRMGSSLSSRIILTDHDEVILKVS
jgi:hypothetical protein